VIKCNVIPPPMCPPERLAVSDLVYSESFLDAFSVSYLNSFFL
jgi:hypothetical protein